MRSFSITDPFGSKLKTLTVCLAALAMVVAVLQTTRAAAEPTTGGPPRLAIEDLDYQGAFRLRLTPGDYSDVGYSPGVIGLGGGGSSLFVEGHPHTPAIAEYPLAGPSRAATLAELPLSGEPLQPFAPVFDRAAGGNPQAIDRFSGLIAIDGALLVNGFEYYDAATDNTHTTLAVADADDLAGSAVSGWGEMTGAAHAAGWMSPIPAEWQPALGGTHLSGSSSGIPIIGRASVGPSAFVVDLDPSLGAVDQARPVLDFSLANPLAADLTNDSGTNDLWTHLSRATYGFIVPGTSTYLTLGSSAGHDSGITYGQSPHNGYKGYYPNEVSDKSPYYWLWDVNDLMAVGNGSMQPHDVRPYDHGALDLPFADFGGDRWDDVGGAAYDPTTGRLYISLAAVDTIQNRYSPVPVILAYDIDVPTHTTPVDPTPTPEDPPPIVVDPTPDPGTPDPDTPDTPDASPDRPDFCPSYETSDLYRSRSRQITVGPDDDWQAALLSAPSDSEILLEDGVYDLTRYALYLEQSDLTIRSARGDREAVVIRGQGYGTPSEGLMIAGERITVADLTMTAMRNHAISIKPEGGAAETHVYNVNLFDNGTQQIKASAAADNRRGVVACSSIGYTPGGVQGDYIAAIDLHRAVDWVIRDNHIYNVTGDGSGCEIDIDCGTYVSHPAILIWTDSRNAVIERNTIVDSWRAITLGLGQGYSGGVVRNNFIHQSQPGDAGIELHDAHDVVVEHNTVMVKDYRGAIEYGGSTNITVRNNLISTPPLERPERGPSPGAVIEGNIVDATDADFAVAGQVDLVDGSRAVGAGVASSVAVDIHGDARIGRWDVGADQDPSAPTDGSDGSDSGDGGGDSGECSP